MIGYDKSVELRLKRRSIERGSRQKATILFSDVSTMKDFGLSPVQWRRLSWIDKRVMHYYRLMQNFYDDIANENAKQYAEMQRVNLQQTRKR